MSATVQRAPPRAEEMAPPLRASAPTPAARRRGPRSWWQRLVRNPLALGSLLALVLIHLLVFAGPLVWRLPPQATDPLTALGPPSATHPLGTDELGRDQLSRMLYGGRVTLLVGFAAMAASIVLGVFVGAASGFYGGWVSTVLMRLTDAMMAVPAFFLIITAVTVLGTGPATLILVIGASAWMQVARVMFGETLRWKTFDFVQAAEVLGARRTYLLVRHILPQTIPSVVVSATLGIGFAILTESAVSYLGLGIQPPTPSWGNMLQNAQQYVWTAPALAFYPGAAVTIVVLAYNFLGDGLRDALDPRLRI